MHTFLAKLIEPPRDNIPVERQMFSNLDLKKLIVPLIFEQVLVMMVGMVGTMMVSYAGEADMSAPTLSRPQRRENTYHRRSG